MRGVLHIITVNWLFWIHYQIHSLQGAGWNNWVCVRTQWIIPVPGNIRFRGAVSPAGECHRFTVVSRCIEGLLWHGQHWRNCWRKNPSYKMKTIPIIPEIIPERNSCPFFLDIWLQLFNSPGSLSYFVLYTATHVSGRQVWAAGRSVYCLN